MFSNNTPQQPHSNIFIGDIQSILKKYGIYCWYSIKKIKLEATNKIYIHTNGSYYVINAIPWHNLHRQYTRAQVKLQQILSEHGLNIPKIIHTTSGHCFVEYHTITGSYFFTLQELGTGNAWQNNLKQTKNMAKTLARLHNISASIDWKSKALQLPKKNLFQYIDKQLANAEQQKNRLSPLVEYFHLQLCELAKHADQYDYTDLQIGIHGDFQPLNLLFDENAEVSAILSFNQACIDNPLNDLARALLRSCFFIAKDNSLTANPPPDRFNFVCAKTILETYLQHIDIDCDFIKHNLANTCAAVSIDIILYNLLHRRFASKDAAILRDLPKSVYQYVTELLAKVNFYSDVRESN